MMRRRSRKRYLWAAAFVLLVSAPRIAAAQSVDTCVACHRDLDDDRLRGPVKIFADDVHRAKGFTCASCHGGDPRAEGAEAMDPDKGYIGVPTKQQVQQVCGRCHSDANFMRHYNPSLRVDQLTEYQTSVHGRRLQENGDTRVATCSNCHSSHGVRPVSDPRSPVHPLRVVNTCASCHANAKYMAQYGIPTDQHDKYRTSVHAAALAKGDLSAPTCNDCHGNHGATPPGVTWVGNVCGQCHAVMAEQFTKSKHAQIFADLGSPGCATCHNNHDVKKPGDLMVGVTEGAVCATCHGSDDEGGKVATGIRTLLDRLRGAQDRGRAILLRAEHAGMEVSQPQFELNGAADALVKARAAVHSFTVGEVKQHADAGLAIAAKAEARGVRALEELDFRRKGLAASLVITLALIVGLVLKIREVDQRQTTEQEKPSAPSTGAART